MAGPTKEAVDHVSSITGLKVATVRDLLESGWTYAEGCDMYPTWYHPLQSRPEKKSDRIPK